MLLTRQKILKPEGFSYYRAAADFWYEVVGLQQAQCLEESGNSIEARADLNLCLLLSPLTNLSCPLQTLNGEGQQEADDLQLETSGRHRVDLPGK